jgi:hypothetical protein
MGGDTFAILNVKYISIAVVLLAVFLGVVAAVHHFQYTAPTIVKTPLASSSATKDVLLDAWVDDSRVLPEQIIHYRIGVTNLTRTPMSKIRVLSMRAPDFAAKPSEAKCWDATLRVPKCAEKDGVVTALDEIKLEANEALTIEGDLSAPAAPGTYGIGAMIGWSETSRVYWRTIRISPIAVEDPTRRAYLRAVRTTFDAFKDFALPIVLAWLAFTLRKIEEDRKKSQEKADERNAQVQQTWTLMLPKMHANAEKYYMPLMSEAGSVKKYYDGDDRDPGVCFFFYLLFFARMKRMIDEISGFYLRYRSGEDVVSVIWVTLMDLRDARVTRPVRENAQAILSPNLSYAAFVRTKLPLPEMTKLHDDFVDGAAYDEFVLDVQLLELFAAVLTYEVNCSYEFWYGVREEFPADDWHRLYANIVGLSDLLPPKKYSSLIDELDRYASDIDRRQTDPGLDGGLNDA